MLKHVSICAALLAFGIGSPSARQKEAVLQKMEIPTADYDIILAMPKASGATFDFGETPDALIIHLIGDELAVGFDSEEQMLKTLSSLLSPVGAFHIRDNENNTTVPVAVYLVAKHASSSAQK